MTIQPVIRYIFTLSLLFLVTTAKGQETAIRGLIKAIQDLPGEDYPNPDSLMRVSFSYFKNESDTLVARLNLSWASYYNHQFKYDSARMFAEESVRLYERNGKDKLGLAQALHFLGQISYDIEDIATSISCYHRALQIYDGLNMKLKVAKLYNAIANSYAYIAEYNLALTNYQLARDLYKAENDSSGVALVLGNIGSHYAETKQLDKALSVYEQSLLWSKDNPVRKLDILLGIGIVKEEQKIYDGAEAYYREAAKLAKEIQDNVQLAYAYQNLAFLYLKTEDLDSIPKYVKLAQNLGEKYSILLLQNNLKEIQHDYLYKIGNYKAAYDLLKRARAASDSFYDLDMTRQLQEVQAKFNNLKQENELAQKDMDLEVVESRLEFNELVRNALITVLVLVSIMVLLVYRSHKNKTLANQLLQQKNDQIEEKNRQIVSIEESKTKWFVNIAHELRTPLTLIKGPIRQALQSLPQNQQVYNDLKIADRNISRLQKLVDEILDISKMEDGKMELNRANVNITELILNCLASFDSAARNVKVKLEFELNPEEPVILLADKSKISNVMTNLVSNALKFTHEGGKITVSLMKEFSTLAIIVEDTGEGIPEKDLPHIFDRFYQASNAIGKKGGTGVGLALCKEIAKMHGGDILAFSTIGKGSIFKLTLPLVKDEEMEVESLDGFSDHMDEPDALEVVNDHTIHSYKKKILIVEDNADMREYMSSFLKNEYEILEARDGIEGLEQLSREVPNLIISDIMMPRMDGIKFAKEVKSNPQWKFIPFVTVSAIGDESEKVKTLRIGIDDYLVKPFFAEELFVRIQNLIYNYQERLASIGDDLTDPDEISYEEKLLKKLEEEVYNNIEDPNFNVIRLAEIASMSERQLYRYLKQMTGLTPANYVREIRLQRAMDLIQKGIYKRTSQVSYAVGFQQPSYFSTVFKKRFGRLPADYIEE